MVCLSDGWQNKPVYGLELNSKKVKEADLIDYVILIF